jgi:hypothetical protein
MRHIRGIYTGPRRELRGHYAILQPTPGGNYLAQFDSRQFTEAFGWHFFFRRHFKELSRLRLGRSQSHRRALRREEGKALIAEMRKWAQPRSWWPAC